MLKKSILLTSLILFSNFSHADTCPTPLEIKTNIFHNWQPLDVNSAEPITDPEEINQFQNNVTLFSLAEWMPDAPEGPSHCYYSGKDQDPLEIYLVKITNAPEAEDQNWKPASLDTLHCTAGTFSCRFQDKI